MSLRSIRLLPLFVLVAILTGGCAGTDETTLDGRYSLTVVTENEHTYAAGETSVGPLVIVGGTTALQEGAEHHGTVTTLAGDLTLEGTVHGDLLALGGTIRMGESGVVTGDVQRAGGELVRAQGSTVQGDIVESTDPAELVGGSPADSSVLDRVVWAALTAALMAALAWTLVRLAPRPAGRVRAAATAHPVVSGALGTLVLLTAPALLVSMVFTLVLIPLAIALLIPFAAVVTYGVLGLGLGTGTRITEKLGWHPSAATTAAIGTALLVAAVHLTGTLPLLGLLTFFVISAVGTGAVLLTALGTRPYVVPAEQ
jgi:hypothetical protein